MTTATDALEDTARDLERAAQLAIRNGNEIAKALRTAARLIRAAARAKQED